MMSMAKFYVCPTCGKTLNEHGLCSCGSKTEQWVKICGEALPVSMLNYAPQV